jgi:hypothetical protein
VADAVICAASKQNFHSACERRAFVATTQGITAAMVLAWCNSFVSMASMMSIFTLILADAGLDFIFIFASPSQRSLEHLR